MARCGTRRRLPRSSGASAVWARSKYGAGITPSHTTPQSATRMASEPASEGTITVAAPSGSRMYITHHDAEVVVGGDGGVEHPDHRQPHIAGAAPPAPNR